MSTIAYAQLTNVREAASSGTSTATGGSPGLRTYVDAFAALVPSEVLTLHALIIAATTKPATSTKGGEAGTIIDPTAVHTLQLSFWGLVALAVLLYAVPRAVGGKWDRFDWIRALIAPLAFCGWTMLQRTTAFDAAFPEVALIPRTVAALFLGAVLGAVTALLSMKADAK